MRLPKDLREFIESLNSHYVDYVIVGAYALAFHGHPRCTVDIDNKRAKARAQDKADLEALDAG